MRLHQPHNSSGCAIQDPPRQIAENLYVLFYHGVHGIIGRLLIPKRLNYFLPFAPEFGFFLNIPRFHASMLQACPPGHPSRPAPALIFSTYLFAILISNDPLVKPNEAAYVQRATQEAATALSGNHPQKVMHSIQAEVLLATYFFSTGSFFQGKYHVANAVSTAVSAGLHKLRSSGPTSPVTLPPHRDVIEEGERIICAWNVFNLDKCWAVALDDTPNFEHSTHALAAKIDTPWPLDMDEFEQVSFLIYHQFLFRTDTERLTYRRYYPSTHAPRLQSTTSLVVFKLWILVCLQGRLSRKQLFYGIEQLHYLENAPILNVRFFLLLQNKIID